MNNCIYCKSRIFPEDRSCSQCGAPVFAETFSLPTVDSDRKYFITSVSDSFIYDFDDELLFSGKSLISSSIEITLPITRNGVKYIFGDEISAVITDLKRKQTYVPTMGKGRLVLESQLAMKDSTSANVVGKVQVHFPKVQYKIGKKEMVECRVLQHIENGTEISGYVVLDMEDE